MNHTTLQRAASGARKPAVASNRITRELRRYGELLRDERELATGTQSKTPALTCARLIDWLR